MENKEISKNRMVLLLRNSTKKQAEKKINDSGKIEYDIPLQRNILTPWAERQGYVIYNSRRRVQCGARIN